MQLEKMEPIVKKFYQGLEEGKLYGRRCLECGAIEFPPHLACNACGYHATEWCEVSGHGRLIDFTVPGPQNDKPYLREVGKYAYGAVELDEGPAYTYVIFGITKKKAADIRADNGGIVGAFVLAGEPLSWGLSKKGYCAVIGDTVTIGTADNSPLFERATETGGYFFRQYPLVSNGRLVENNPKGKSIRRAICDRQGEILMVGTLDTESFHDFSQALVDLGVDQAIYLVGASSYGWAVDGSGTRHEFGNENIHTSGRHKMSDNTSYIVWRRK